MPWLALLASVVSGCAWSGFDIARKRISADLPASSVVMALCLGQIPVFAAAAFVLGQWRWPQPSFWLPIAASIALNLVANIGFVRAVALAPLSASVPMLSLSPVFAALGGLVVLGELLSTRQGLGIALILLGALSLQSRQLLSNSVDRRARSGILLMSLVAFCFALSTVVDKLAMRSSTLSVYAISQCAGIALALAIWPRQTKNVVNRLKAESAKLLVAIVFAAVAFAAQLVAIAQMPLGLFEAIKRAIGLALAVFVGRIFFAERVTVSQFIGAAVMGAGLFLALL